jgi:hypothetical protein
MSRTLCSHETKRVLLNLLNFIFNSKKYFDDDDNIDGKTTLITRTTLIATSETNDIKRICIILTHPLKKIKWNFDTTSYLGASLKVMTSNG